MHDMFDVIILGGGCAGLSLASRLTATGEICPRVVVLESRSAYLHDRTWCFFQDEQAVSQHPIQHSWPSMNVTSCQGSVAFDCGTTPYQMVHAGEFYQNAQSIINQSGHVELKMGVSITKTPEKQDSLWRIDTETGALFARYVVDTRPVQRPVRGGAKLWQSFYGEEIDCSEDIFDPLSGDLMDFSAADACGAKAMFPDAVCFVYVLPTSKARALLEFTAFGPDPLSPDRLKELYTKAVTQRLAGAHFSVLRTEHGVLPMGPLGSVPSGDASYVFAGLTAGGARPSSGYAFARIQRWAARCADSLASGHAPVGHARDGLILRVMDALFLKLVRTHPQIAPDLFTALFACTQPQSVIRFLNDRATFTDYARVVIALVPGPLWRALVSRNKHHHNAHPLLETQ